MATKANILVSIIYGWAHRHTVNKQFTGAFKWGIATKNAGKLDKCVPINNKSTLHIHLIKNIVDKWYTAKVTRGINATYKKYFH